jgi:hypothetical protein
MDNIELITKIIEHTRFNVQSKSNESEDDAKLRRFREKWLFISTLISIGIMYLCCSYFILFSSYPEIALNGIMGLTMALIGYYVRGKNGNT